jgi:uncharacterized membrane protein
MQTLALFVSFLIAVQTMIHKKALQKITSDQITAIVATIYFVLSLGYLIMHHKEVSKTIRSTDNNIVLLIGLTVAISIFSSVVYFRLVERHNVTLVSALLSTAPLFVALMSVYFFKETLAPRETLGIVVLVAGLMLMA